MRPSHPHPSIPDGRTVLRQAQHKQVHLVLSASANTEAEPFGAFLQLHREVVVVLQTGLACMKPSAARAADSAVRTTDWLVNLGSEVSRDPQRELGSCRMLPEVQQTGRLPVIQRGRLAIIRYRRVAVVHRRLPVVGERGVTEIRFHVLSGFNL